jgi:hypothetical protein
MSQAVFLHVGLPKSGTSYLQGVLSTNKDALMRDEGLLFPGKSWQQQVLAVQDVREMNRHRGVDGAWARLVAEIAAWPGDAVVSMEWLCAASEDVVRRIVADLAPARVEVVFTARDLGRTIPAAWQEFLKGRQDWTWEEFLEGVSSPDPLDTSAGRRFWAQQDLPGLLRRWAAIVPADHVHVVTVPPPGAAPDVLWTRMADVLGIASEGYGVRGRRGNESLGLESAELMRRLNPLTREAGASRATYKQVFTQGLAKRTLAPRRDRESRVSVPPAHHDWVRETATRHLAEIREIGVQVVGDLDDLKPVLREGRQPADVADGEVLEVALAGLVALGLSLDAVRREKAALAARVARLEGRLERTQRRSRTQAERARTTAQRVRAFEDRPIRSAVRLRLRSLRRR